jgi:hypothetical protein
MGMPWVEIVGYAGTVLVGLSLMMANIRRLRWVNLFGAATLAVYGLLIQAWPVVTLNGFIVVVDAFYLIKLARERDVFSFFEVPSSMPFLREFLRFYRADIESFAPGFDLDRHRQSQVRLILRNMLPVGLFVCGPSASGEAEIHLDYVVPGYRDFKGARFVYSADHERLRAAGLHTFVATATVPAQRRYFRRVGFVQDLDQPWRFTRPV